MDDFRQPSSPYRISDLRSSRFHEPRPQGSRHLAAQPYADRSFGSLQLPASSVSSLPLALGLNLQAGDDDPFIDTSGDESAADSLPATSKSSTSGVGTEQDEGLRTPSLPDLPLMTLTDEHEELSDEEGADPPSNPPSTRLVPGPGSAFSDDEYVASANESVDGEGEEELDDLPDSPPATLVTPKRQASASTAAKKTFKDGLWE